MDSKRVGITVLVLGFVLLGIFTFSSHDLTQQSEELGCFDKEECKPIQPLFSLVNVGFGFFGFIFALGIYLLVFAKGEKALLRVLTKEQETLTSDEKFSILLMGLDGFEQRVLQEVKKQDGITQNTLFLRADMSKAKLSHVLTELEKKRLIKRVPHKKTLAVHLSFSL